MKNKISILDCTLRDGSYAIDYQFNAEDTFLISSSLASANIEYIEVGHGLGLGAHLKGKGDAAESDYKYVEAALSATKKTNSKVGVFFIPGIGKPESIIEFANLGIDFIRIGTNANETDQAKNCIEIAKKSGLEVSANLMKSYALSPDKLASRVKEVSDFGADIVSIVDSAGGMTPDEVTKYIDVILQRHSIPLGFHGHNNLQLAHANCLAAVKAGVTVVDGSLRGMGRSAGNAATEVLVGILSREGFDVGDVSLVRLMNMAENLIAPVMRRDYGLDREALASGLSYFHSSYQNVIDRTAAEQNVAAFEIILNLGSKAKLEVTDKLAVQTANSLKPKEKQLKRISKTNQDLSTWYKNSPNSIERVFNDLVALEIKNGCRSVLTVAISYSASSDKIRIASLKTGYGFNVGHIELPGVDIADELVKLLRNNSLFTLLADDLEGATDFAADYPKILNYDDKKLRIEAISDFIQIMDIKDFYCSDKKITELIMSSLPKMVYSPISKRSLLIAIDENCKLTKANISELVPNGVLLICQNDSVELSAIEQCLVENKPVHRLDSSQALLTEVARKFGTLDRLQNDAGKLYAEDFTFVAGGVLGAPGDIILDSIRQGAKIIGVADGKGGVLEFSSLTQLTQNKVLQWLSINLASWNY